MVRAYTHFIGGEIINNLTYNLSYHMCFSQNIDRMKCSSNRNSVHYKIISTMFQQYVFNVRQTGILIQSTSMSPTKSSLSSSPPHIMVKLVVVTSSSLVPQKTLFPFLTNLKLVDKKTTGGAVYLLEKVLVLELFFLALL